MPTTLSFPDVQDALFRLGYYDGSIGVSPLDPNFMDDLARFQKDVGFDEEGCDGVYGPKTEKKLLPYFEQLAAVEAAGILPPGFSMRRWRLTNYYIGEEATWDRDQARVPMSDPDGKLIAEVPYRCFSEAAMEGTTRLTDGRLANVASRPAYRPCDPEVFQPVFEFAKDQGWLPDLAGYAGIACDSAGTRATQAKTFHLIHPGEHGFPVIARQECLPWKTLATDVGVLGRHDPAYKGLGGVCPRGTRVFILEYLGAVLPDGSTHDGWFVANDTGGAIYGAHFDVFVGFKSLYKQGPRTPSRAHVWFEGIEGRVETNYSYGL